MKVSITHGTMGTPKGNWFPWLSDELQAQGHSVICPQYPTPENQHLDNWCSTFDEEFGFPNLDGEAILVGHSCGVPFVLNVLKEADVPVKACFLVAGFVGKLGISEFDDLNETFIRAPFDWEFLKTRVGQAFVYHADNDPYVPLEMGSEIAEMLGADFKILPGGGHLNADSGYLEFPQLLDDIKRVGSLS